MAEVVQGTAALQKRLKAIGETRPVMRALQLSSIAEAHRLVPRKTGYLQRTIQPGTLTDTSAEVKATANYAAYVEFGTKPHIIRPKNRKALRWPLSRRLSGRARSGSGFAFAAIVHHPGTKPHPFLIAGAKAALAKSKLADIIVSEWNKAG